MNTTTRSLLLTIGLLLTCTVSAVGAITLQATSATTRPNRLITRDGAGPIRLGMTVAQARRSLRGHTLSRTSDGEGVALIAVKRQGTTIMTLYAGEVNPKARINERARIEFIEVWDENYHTAAGVRPRMKVLDAAKRYGPLQEIMMSEIEMREYATFAKQPTGIQLRLMADDGPAGMYSEGQNTTMRYSPSVYIASISVTGRTPDAAKFSSTYTQLKSDCNRPALGPEAQHSSLYCKGHGNYRIHIFDSAMSLHIHAETIDKKFTIPLATQSLDYDQQGHRIEWRLADGKPFAVILRVFKYSGAGEYPLQEKPIGEVLLVKGLKGFEEIELEVDVKGMPNVNERARELADSAYLKKSREN